MLTNTERQQIVEEVNAGTYGIDEALDDIAAAQKGEEVRKALYAEALVLNREGHAGSTDMIARQQIANLQTSVNGQISTLRTEVGEDIDDLETALNSGLATQNGRIAAQNATIANVVANYNVEYGSTELWTSTGETGALAAGTTVTLSEDVSHFDYIDIYSFCGNSNVLDTVPVDAKLQSSAGYALRWVNLSDPGSGSYKAYVRIVETRLHIIGTTLTIDHQVTYRNGEEVNISGAEVTQSNRSTYMGEFGIMKIVGRKITANTEIEDVRIGADGTEYASAGQAVRAQIGDVADAIPAIDDGLDIAGAAADAKTVGDALAEKADADDVTAIDARVTAVESNVSDLTEVLKEELKQTYNILLGGTNLLEFQVNSKTTSGITFTENADGTVTANGTATANAIYAISFTPALTGLYHLFGCPSGGNSSQYYQRINSVTGNDTGSGVDVELVSGTDYYVWIVIVSGRTVENLEFEPTLIPSSENISSVLNVVNLLPFKVQTPTLFEGGMDGSTGHYHHDTNETWVKSRIRTGVVRVAKGAILATSGNYKLTVCKYADYELTNYIETILDATATTKWTCQNEGYYSFTFMLSTGGSLTMDTVKSAWDFSQFYCIQDERLKVHWIGTGIVSETSTYTDSGDCALVVFPDGTGLLIDGANKRNYASIRKRLAEAGFYHIKNIIISHFHADHIGGIIQMVNSNYIDITGATVYLPDYDATLYAYDNGIMDDATKTLYDEAMAIFSDAGCNLVYPDTDFKPYEIGGAVLSFYNTDTSYYEGRSSNYNDWSLCNYIFYGNVNINFTGDLGPIGQSHLGGTVYKSDIYKADHHGWLNQTVIPPQWINNMSPDVVIALDGAIHDTYLGTDTAPLVKWCDKNGVPYYRKYTNGEIVMAVSKDSWSFETKTTRYELPTA